MHALRPMQQGGRWCHMTGAGAGGAKGPHRSGAGVRLQLRLRDSAYSESMRTAFLLLLAAGACHAREILPGKTPWLLGNQLITAPPPRLTAGVAPAQLGNVHRQVISARELVADRVSQRVTGSHKRCAPHAYVVKSRPEWALRLSACLRELQIELWHQRPALPISPPSARCGPLA
jgi:hypothetical protein